MKIVINILLLSLAIGTSSPLKRALASAKADSPYYFQCQQTCTNMTSRETFQVVANTAQQAQYLINRSCENTGKKPAGKMTCVTIEINEQNTEPYQACLNGTNNTLWWTCRSTGKVYVMRKGWPTQAIALKYNLSKRSFYESDQALLRECKKYQNGFPDAEVVCAFLYHDVWKQ